jgi:hypothetical protein
MFGESIFDFFRVMSARSEQDRIQRETDELGIKEDSDGYYGSDKIGIPYYYADIEISEMLLKCRIGNNILPKSEGYYDVYTTKGEFIFNGDDFTSLGQGMFLVGMESKKGDSQSKRYAIYNYKERVSEFVYRSTMGVKFNHEGFCALHCDEWNEQVVVNKKGEVIFKKEGYDSLYIDGVICHGNKCYINLLTGERICSEGYRSVLSTNECIFVQLGDNSVYQISKINGAYIIHGEPEKYTPPKPPEPEKERVIEKGTQPLPKPPGRNDPCSCGKVSESGKPLKYKNCCGKIKQD